MKAGVFLGPGIAEVREWPDPVVGPGQVKVKIAYAGICGSDVESLNHRMGFQRAGLNFNGTAPGRTGAVVEGHEATGTIVEVGPGLKGDWQVGQRVVLSLKAACGACYYCRTKRESNCEHPSRPSGAFAEYAIYPEGTLFALPDDVSFELAALTEPTSIGVHAVDCAGIRNGQTLAISGAGTIGLVTLAVALHAGACKVLVSEPIASKRQIALRMGADVAIDPLSEDLAAAAARLTDGRGFDAVIEASGNLGAATQMPELLDKGGTLVWTGVYPYNAEIPVQPFHMYLKELTIRSTMGAPYCFQRALNLLPKLNIGSLVTNIYPLDEFAEAFRNHEKGQSIKTLIKM
jgi:(R,R)-butanediol dehydrogenase/meso-butanediol dehydrogenase/diacetyl reductase/L-iditol 2-dehydrogenase